MIFPTAMSEPINVLIQQHNTETRILPHSFPLFNYYRGHDIKLNIYGVREAPVQHDLIPASLDHFPHCNVRTN
jgi:hypothetical protein